jgi:hypothetical protein
MENQRAGKHACEPEFTARPVKKKKKSLCIIMRHGFIFIFLA